MTIPDAPPDPPSAPPPGSGRVTRPKLSRGGPNRSSLPPQPAEAYDPLPAIDKDGVLHTAPISEAIAQAVQRGYRVIGDNIEQGRAAAAEFRAGQYNVRDVPYDLNQMTLRLLDLTRQISGTTCDILEKLLRDQKFPGAVPRSEAAATGGQGAAPRAPRDFAPPGFRAAPPPPGPAMPTTVPLEVVFTGKAGTVRAASLSRPETPTPLVLPALAALDPALPPIRGATFSASADGQGVAVNISLAPDQPAGLYSGVICASDSMIPVGSLTVEVQA